MPQIRQGVFKSGLVITPGTPFPYSSGKGSRQVSETLLGNEGSGSIVGVTLSWAIHCFCLIQDIYLLAAHPTFLTRLFFFFLPSFGCNFRCLQAYK